MDTFIPSKNENLLNQDVNKSKKIAIIGSGISGLSTAWLLSKKHKVTIYEKEDKLGGHSNTININYNKEGNQEVPISVDTGFIVFIIKRKLNFLKIINKFFQNINF